MSEAKVCQAIMYYKHKPCTLAPLPSLIDGVGVVRVIVTTAAIQMGRSDEYLIYAEFAVSQLRRLRAQDRL